MTEPQASPLQVAYLPAARASGLHDVERHLLAAIHYAAPDAATPPGHIVIPLQALGAPLMEVWLSAEPVTRGEQQDISFSCNDEVLVGSLCVPEHACADLEAAVFEAYSRVYAVARERQYPHPLRIWNFFPAINGEQGGLERYQAFCQGRHRALETLVTAPLRLPAASAIGTRSGGLRMYFIAAREPGWQVENPRQVSAFHYPRRYSPKSPSFSRAIVKRWRAVTHLYISGTASIVGHESRHPADTLAQLKETLNNLGTLIRHASRQYPLGLYAVSDLSLLKIYVRAADDRDAIAARVAEMLGPELPVLLLHGDICRRDLYLEMEGLFTGPPAHS